MPAILAAVLTALGLAVLTRLAPRLGLLDHPGGHKQHATPVPAVGGLALFFALTMVWLFTRRDVTGGLALLGSAVLLAMGVWDDRRGLRARTRLVAQLVAAGLMLAAGAQIHTLGDLLGFGVVHLGAAVGALFTVVCAVALINAMNMVDGLDA